MSTITGYLKQVVGTPASNQVTLRMAAWPSIEGNALVVPDQVTVVADVIGFWSVTLAKGVYEISVAAKNGQTAKPIIDVPDDDNTYSFEQRVISSIPAAVPPVGGAQPTASAEVLGLVKTDETVGGVGPIVATGFFWKLDYAAVRLLANKANNKIAFVSGTDDEWDWSAVSTAVDTGLPDTTVLKPDDTVIGNPGRWLKRAAGGGGGGSGGGTEVVGNLAAMKALVSSASLKQVILHAPEPGVGKVYYFIFGDVTAVLPDEPYSIVAPDDGGGRFFVMG